VFLTMRRIRNMLVFIAVVAAMTVGATSAMASPQAVIRDCARDGKLDHHYSMSDLKNALKQLPADVNEYTNCHDVITAAETQGTGGQHHGSSHSSALHGTGGSGRGGGGGGGGTASQGDMNALADATHQGGNAPSLSLRGQKVVPGSGGLFKTAGAANSLPVPVLLALIAVALLTAAGGVVAVRRRFPEVIGAALRIFRR
jgi:hypothetical protein